jgi:multidrug transporter EmrE-like cation transporter
MQKFIALASFAALSFSIGGYFMKQADGLAKFRPSLFVFIFFVVGACLQTVAMRDEQMSITYIMILGLEAITALSLSIFLLKESASLTKLAGVGLVLVGIVLLRSSRP